MTAWSTTWKKCGIVKRWNENRGDMNVWNRWKENVEKNMDRRRGTGGRVVRLGKVLDYTGREEMERGIGGRMWREGHDRWREGCGIVDMRMNCSELYQKDGRAWTRGRRYGGRQWWVCGREGKGGKREGESKVLDLKWCWSECSKVSEW